ncbi:sucrase-isomaltase, intestinal isoform X2 [Hyalella azteca]|uniref:Sucrase-isomaltase, intestinal isoform X1 n=1 Tax=Hyalella azteca TaxID=294128 RepID=A0A8B7PBP8_HYAAZ|nr:sucrase-isomaltase, intestinal isoform X1 [Hyalella azteca]XP_018023590.1 sucrase-isomaltase, intestinal isoform X2 [Hyalella azteca]
MASRRHLVATLLLLIGSVAAQNGIECPFPGGTENGGGVAECSLYTACLWKGSECVMQNNGDIGYTVAGDPQDTGRGFKVGLDLIDATKTLFGGDIPGLELEVIYHEDYHVQVKIRDAASARYEVPVPLTLPAEAGTLPLYTVEVAAAGQPFEMSISRAATGTKVFSTVGALVYENQFIQFTTQLPSTYLYGFGENTHSRLRHTFEPRNTWPIFARDQPVGTGFMNEYGHHPYYSVVEDDAGHTHSVLFFNSNAMEYSTFLLSDGSPALTLRTIGGIIDLHFFFGPTPEDVNMQYAAMIGTTELPPYWSLGFHLSRWGYKSTDHVREVRQRMKEAGIPQDVQVIDIDYMENSRDFTIGAGNWSDLPQLVEELHSDGLKVTLILDPAVVIDFDNYEPVVRGRDADAFIKWMTPSLVPGDQPAGTNDYMVGYVWPDNKTVFPDFLKPETQDWWAQEIALFHQMVPFDSLWIDMNEPSNFGTNLDKPSNYPDDLEPWSLKCPFNFLDSPPYPTKMTRVGFSRSGRISDRTLCMSGAQTNGNDSYLLYDTHSLYGWSESVATHKAMELLFPGKRQLVLSRSTFPGSAPYAIHWLGDNEALWDDLARSVIGLIEFNLFGMPMVGADICGFSGRPTQELCARWMQLGAFYPFSRNHNAKNSPDQDPAVHPQVAEISKDVLLLRYKYLPYLYTLLHDAHMGGSSVVRPLYNVFPRDVIARDVDDQFFWGTGIMVAPVIAAGLTERDVYFPEGLWYDLASGARVSSLAGLVNVAAPLEVLPVFVRGGTILPNQAPATTTQLSRENPFGLTIALDSAFSAEGALFWDDGEYDRVMTYTSTFTFANNTLTSVVTNGQDELVGLSFDNVAFYGYPSNPTAITVNGEALDPSTWAFEEAIGVLNVKIDVPLDVSLDIQITV